MKATSNASLAILAASVLGVGSGAQTAVKVWAPRGAEVTISNSVTTVKSPNEPVQESLLPGEYSVSVSMHGARTFRTQITLATDTVVCVRVQSRACSHNKVRTEYRQETTYTSETYQDRVSDPRGTPDHNPAYKCPSPEWADPTERNSKYCPHRYRSVPRQRSVPHTRNVPYEVPYKEHSKGDLEGLLEVMAVQAKKEPKPLSDGGQRIDKVEDAIRLLEGNNADLQRKVQELTRSLNEAAERNQELLRQNRELAQALTQALEDNKRLQKQIEELLERVGV